MNKIKSYFETPIKRKLNIIFFGAPIFSEASLKKLEQSADKISLVITPPDKPAGRGRKTFPTAIKTLAQKLNLPIYQPESLNDPETLKIISDLKPDLLVIVAYGNFLPPQLLNLCLCPPINLHPSLLPQHRGPAPALWSIIKGDKKAGVSVIFLDKGMDTGAILKQKETEILKMESGGELETRLSLLGAELLIETISDLKKGNIIPKIQAEDIASTNPLFKKDDGLIDWNKPAQKLAQMICGLDPWPGAFSFLNKQKIKFFKALAKDGNDNKQSKPGTVIGLEDEALIIATAKGDLHVYQLQAAGKKRTPSPSFVCGYQPKEFTNK